MAVKIGLKYIDIWKDSMEDAVVAYEKENATKGEIVFYGPSNFTRWRRDKWGATPLREALPGKSGKPCAINRGFGSSCPEHHLYYYSRMVRPLAPKVLVYAPGLGNGTGFGYTPQEMFDLAPGEGLRMAQLEDPKSRTPLDLIVKDAVFIPRGMKIKKEEE